jgi:restriction system protein
MVRGGKHGQQEALALENNLACIGWYELPDLSGAKNRNEFRKIVEKTYPRMNEFQLSILSGQLHNFLHEIKVGDLVVMPMKTTSQIAIGKISGPYQYREDLGETHHVRRAQWLKTDLPRTNLGPDLLASLRTYMTVCRIKRNDAETRMKAILEGKPDPGKPEEPGTDTDEALLDVEQMAQDQILSYMESRFKGHALARLVNAVLQAEGYVTQLSTPGPDGGADILARRGSLGLEGPRMCVQVKSSNSPSDVTVFRGLQGSMATFKADEGLLVSWGGFNSVVQKEARLSFFSIRLWDADDLLAAVTRNYDKLPEELQTDLPLKRIWALVPGDSEGE